MRVIEPSFWIVYWPNNAMSAPPALTPLPFSSLDSTLGALYVGKVSPVTHLAIILMTLSGNVLVALYALLSCC